LREGAPIDLIASADERTLDALAARGLLEAGSRVDLLANALVAIAPDDAPPGPRDPHDLAGPG